MIQFKAKRSYSLKSMHQVDAALDVSQSVEIETRERQSERTTPKAGSPLFPCARISCSGGYIHKQTVKSTTARTMCVLYSIDSLRSLHFFPSKQQTNDFPMLKHMTSTVSTPWAHSTYTRWARERRVFESFLTAARLNPCFSFFLSFFLESNAYKWPPVVENNSQSIVWRCWVRFKFFVCSFFRLNPSALILL